MTDAIRARAAVARVSPATWHAALAAAAMLAALLLSCVLFSGEALGALRVWIVSPTFNHCFLVLPLSLFLIWQRRAVLENANVVPDWRASIMVLFLSAVWLVASIAGVLEARQFVVMTMVQVALFGVFGAAFYRKLAAPFLYLYFLVPSGAYLIPFLQAFTARFAVVGLHLLGIPVYSSGAVIEIPAGTFAVAEACAGLRFLVAAVAFGVFFAVVTYRSWLRRLVFVALSVIVPIIANGFRALGLIAVAQWIGNPQAALADHIFYGWIFFSLVLVLLIWIGQRFSDRHENDAVGVPAPEGSEANPVLSPHPGLAALVCMLAAAAAPVAASVLESPRWVDLPRSAPEVALPWRKVPSSADWKPVIIAPSRSFADAFVAGPYRIDRFIALYGGGRQTGNLVRSSNRDADERQWNFDSARNADLPAGGRAVRARLSTWIRGGEKRLVWSFYVVNGKIVSTPWNAKLEAILAYFAARRCVPAYVAFSTKALSDPDSARETGRFLSAMRPLSSYLCEATRTRGRQ